MRASRLLQMLLVLQRRGRCTAAQLADELEVSVRTVYRDVEALSGAGVPVYAESGPGGGIQLIDGYETKLTGLTSDEAASLALAGAPSAAAQLGFGAVLVAAQAKVDAALPVELRGRVVRLRERFLVDEPQWFRPPEETPCLATVAAAVWDAQLLDIVYERAGTAPVRRRVRPLGLVVKSATWYLLADAGRQRQMRTYRISRIRRATSGDHFDRPEGFDLADRWARAAASFAEHLLDIEVVALVPANVLHRLRHALPEPAASQAIAAASPADRTGRQRVVIRSESVEVAHDELLRMGADIEVLEPVELRRRLASTGAALAARHRG